MALGKPLDLLAFTLYSSKALSRLELFLDFLDSGLFTLEVALLLVFSLLGETASLGEVGLEVSSCLFSLGETVPSS